MAAEEQSDGLGDFRFHHPRVEDGLAIWHLIDDAGTLDRNTVYAYLILCRDFAETCLVAKSQERLQGFVTGYLPPREPDALFIWQIGVAPSARGRGLGGRLLRGLLQADACAGVRQLITNVTPSNTASRALFQGLARRLGASIAEEPGFEASLFPDDVHEPERLLRIGPFSPADAHDGPDRTHAPS